MNNPYDSPKTDVENQIAESGGSKKPLIYAILGMITWLIPILGIPVSVVGLIVTFKLRSKSPGSYSVSLVFLILALVLSVVNAGVGAYMGATGKHPIVNKL